MRGLDAGALTRPERLVALKESGLLRHDPAGRLDLLCETACTILRVPIAEVNTLDAEIQTSVGRWPPLTKRATKLVRDTGCREVIIAAAPVIVPNTLDHPTMCMIPAVTQEGAKAYLGVPVYFSGQIIGSFCVIDVEVREWSHWDVAGLQGLARLAGLAVSGDT